MMYIAEIDLKKKKRQLIPLTRICLFGYVDGKRKNLEKLYSTAFIKADNIWHLKPPHTADWHLGNLFRRYDRGGARGFPRFSTVFWWSVRRMSC